MGDPSHLRPSWDDPPSGKNEGLFTKDFFGPKKKCLPRHPGDEAAS